MATGDYLVIRMGSGTRVVRETEDGCEWPLGSVAGREGPALVRRSTVRRATAMEIATYDKEVLAFEACRLAYDTALAGGATERDAQDAGRAAFATSMAG